MNTLKKLFAKGKQNLIIVAALAVMILIFWALNPNFLGK